MDGPSLSQAQQIAQVARAFEWQITGRPPSSVAVVLSEDTLVITLRGTLSTAEMALAKSREGAAQVREFHEQLFTTAAEPLRQGITRITGVMVRDAFGQVEPLSGTAVQVFWFVSAVPAGSWSGADPGTPAAGMGFDQWADGGGDPTHRVRKER